MKVLTVSSSPRKNGNSDLLCDQFLKGAAQAGHMTEKLRLAEWDIRPCTACYGCGETRACIQKDGMTEALDKVMEADVIVLAVPVYFYSMTAQMKIFIDRCFPRYTEIKNKQFYFIVTAADPQRPAAEETLAGLRGFLRCLPGAEERGVVYGTGAWDRGDALRHPAYEKAFEMGKSV